MSRVIKFFLYESLCNLEYLLNISECFHDGFICILTYQKKSSSSYSNNFIILPRSLPLLLPAVEDGIFNDSWRIRQSSVELLGDLLFKVYASHLLSVLLYGNSFGIVMLDNLYFFQVAGTSGKALLEGGSDDEGASTEAQGRAIIEVLGRDKRNEVLAALYMVRSDVSISVRQVKSQHNCLFHMTEIQSFYFGCICHL